MVLNWRGADARLDRLVEEFPTRRGFDRDEITTTTETVAPVTTAETTPVEPVQTYADAEQAVDDDDYGQAVLIAAALGEAERSRIRRAISRALARRVRAAVRRGNRSAARRLLAQAGNYPQTAQLATARSELAAATQRASARRRAREQAAARAREQRAEARRQARERRAAERAAEAQRQAEQAAPEPDAGGSGGGYTGSCATSRSNIPVPPGAPGDRDGDGVACES